MTDAAARPSTDDTHELIAITDTRHEHTVLASDGTTADTRDTDGDDDDDDDMNHNDDEYACGSASVRTTALITDALDAVTLQRTNRSRGSRRIDDPLHYSKILRDMLDITHFNKKLYRCVQDVFHRIETPEAPAPSTNHTRSAKADRAKPLSKAARIREANQRTKDDRVFEDRYTSTVSTVDNIGRVKNPSVKQIIDWLRIADDTVPYTAMILGAVLTKLMAIDNIVLSLELYPEWCAALNAVQDELDRYKAAVATAKRTKAPVPQPSACVKLCREIKTANKSQWADVMRQFEHQLTNTVDVTHRPTWLTYQLREVEGIHPNTLYDIASYRADLSAWQLTLLGHIRTLLTRPDDDDNGGLLVHSATTSGKTTLVLFALEHFIQQEWTIIYLAPNEMLAMQCAAVMQHIANSPTCTNASKARISVFTQNLEISTPAANMYIIVPGFEPELALEGKIMLIMDECHFLLDTDLHPEYRNLVSRIAPAMQRIIGLSATLPDVDSFMSLLTDLSDGIQFDCTGTGVRPVRMRLYDSHGEILHPWSSEPIGVTETDRHRGLTAPDIEHALVQLGAHDAGISRLLTTVRVQQTIGLSGSTVDRIDTPVLDALEHTMTSVLDQRPELSSMCFPRTLTSDVSTANLYRVIMANAHRGGVIVFANDPNLVFELLAQHANRQLNDTVPFWNELLTINRKFVGAYQKLRTHRYLDAVDKLRESKSRGSKVRDTTLTDLVNKTTAEIDRIHRDRTTQLQSLYAAWDDFPSASLIKDMMTVEPDSVSEHYQPPPNMQFGRYAAMDITSVRNIYATMVESQCRIVSNGLAILDDYCDLPTSINIISAFNRRRMNVLITGRHRLATGVNLEVPSAIVYDPENDFTASEIKQMSERPGRKGIDRTGHATIIRKSVC